MTLHIYITYNISMIEPYDLLDSRRSYDSLHIQNLFVDFIPNHHHKFFLLLLLKPIKDNLCNNIILIFLHIRIFIFVDHDDKECR